MGEDKKLGREEIGAALDVAEWGEHTKVKDAKRAILSHIAALDQHVSDLEKSLENVRKERDEALNDRNRHAQTADVWRKRVHDAAEALADVLPGKVGRLDLLARITELKRQRNDALSMAHDSVMTETDQYLASLKPSGQAAEDVARLTESLSSEMGLRLLPEDKAALARLAAKAQGHEAAVLDRGAAIADGAALLEIARFWETMLADVVKNGAGADLGWMGQSKAAEMLAVIRADHPGAALLEQHRKEVEDLKAAMTKAAAELRHTYGHVALGQNINPDLVARAIRILEEASR